MLLPDGLLSSGERAAIPRAVVIHSWGAWDRPAELAANLFAGLRTLDEKAVDRIVCPLPAAEDLGLALCDRLRKAARPR